VVRTLLNLPATAEPAAGFQTDPTTDGFDNNADQLVVIGRLGRDYRRAAEEVALLVATTPSLRDPLVGCTPSGDGTACARTFITSFLRRAYRRPATPAEITRYMTLFSQAHSFFPSGTDPFNEGVQVVIDAALQSASFLYRVELSTTAGLPGFIRLGSHEVAARLALMLWNGLPDTLLDQAADANELQTPEQVAAQAQRMLEDPRARSVVEDFHSQWLNLDGYANLARDPGTFPEFTTSLREPLRDEALSFTNDVVFTQNGNLEMLYTAPFTYVNDATAPLYGLGGPFTPALTRVDLPATERGGLFTQLGFLASHAYPSTSDPIHRGVFIQRKVLCAIIDAPPVGAEMTPLPPLDANVRTMRQRVSAQTSPESCQNCHFLINSAGFAFENYNSIGRYQTMDNGEAVNAAGMLPLLEGDYNFSNALDLMRGISQSDDGKRCYVTQWFRYALQRPEHGGDQCTITQLTTQLGTTGYSIKNLLRDLSSTTAFLYRPAGGN